MPDFPIRRISLLIEDILHEGGPAPAVPYRRGAIMAVVANPFAGRYAADLQAAMEDLKPLGLMLTDRLIAALGGRDGIDAYGKGAMVGGLTGVNRDVIPYAMAFGDHAELAGLNLIGLKRRGLSRDTINAMRSTFRSVFYGSGGGVADRAREAKAKFAGVPEVAEIADFILADAKQELCLARRRGGDAA